MANSNFDKTEIVSRPQLIWNPIFISQHLDLVEMFGSMSWC